MYNGRRRHIQTESIQDQSVKEESVHGHRDGGEKRFESVKNEVPRDKRQNTWQKEKYTKSKTASARHRKRKKKSSMQCYIWFHGCKLDCIHVTIAYAIR